MIRLKNVWGNLWENNLCKENITREQHCQSNVLDLAAGACVGKTCRPRNTEREPASHLCVQPMWLRDICSKAKDQKITSGDHNLIVLWFYWGNEGEQNGCCLWMKRFFLFFLFLHIEPNNKTLREWKSQQHSTNETDGNVNGNGVQYQCVWKVAV